MQPEGLTIDVTLSRGVQHLEILLLVLGTPSASWADSGGCESASSGTGWTCCSLAGA